MVAAGGVLTLALLLPAASDAREIGPAADLCAEINPLDPRQELVLAPGEYQGPCAIRRGGEPGAPLVIRAAEPVRPTPIVSDERMTNVLEVRAGHVVIRGLEFGPFFADPDGMDFSPFPGSLLTSPGALRMRGSMPREDLFGIRRGVPSTMGAIERPSGPISLQPQP